MFLADAPALTLFRASFFPQVRYDPITLLAAIGMVSRRIGLIGTATTTYNEPYELARRLATADHVTGGRIGWNVVTTHNAEAALNFGRDPHPEHDDRYARAAEFVEVTRRLWDSWPEDAIVGDRATGALGRQHAGSPPPTSTVSTTTSPGRCRCRARRRATRCSPRPVHHRPGSSSPARSPTSCSPRSATSRPGSRSGRRSTPRRARHGRPAGSVRILPGLAYVLGSTETEAAERRRALEESVDPELRWRNLAHNAGLDQDLIDPTKPLERGGGRDRRGKTSFAQYIIGQARSHAAAVRRARRRRSPAFPAASSSPARPSRWPT